MPAARPAAGKGGGKKASPTPHADGVVVSKMSRAQKLAAARAAGAGGYAAPAWIDDADMLDAYGQGAAGLGDQWAGDTDSATSGTSGDGGGNGPSKPAAAPNPPARPASPGGGSKGGSGSPGRRSVAPVRATGRSGDAAGVFLGIFAAAFLTNVLKGTGSHWLSAKFLNKVSTTSLPASVARGERAGLGASTPKGQLDPTAVGTF